MQAVTLEKHTNISEMSGQWSVLRNCQYLILVCHMTCMCQLSYSEEMRVNSIQTVLKT